MKIYQIDTFTDKRFGGNPAAVCPLEKWPADEVLQKIANENNLAETAFYVKEKSGYHIRWFTPTVEVDLCGHATLASAYVLFTYEGHKENQVSFQSRSGELLVRKDGDFLTLNFPTDTVKEVNVSSMITSAFHVSPIKAFKGKTDYLLVYENEDQILQLEPDFRLVEKLDARGVIVTSRGKKVDFVSRFFAPQSGINEDPVTGSAHTSLTPYWSKELGKNDLTAMQISARQGFLKCKNLGERTEISGQACTYMVGEILNN
ncbi:MAG: PhzF family phenazine biosynthesis protein [Flavobacteriales bacterium]